jgi:hypothetical protein
MDTAAHTIAIPLTHECKTNLVIEWGTPSIRKVGLRPDVGWELSVVAHCQHCGEFEATTYDWVLEKVPME